MSLGNANIHQRGEIPEIEKLPNNRIRVIRRFQKFTREDVDNANLGSLMGDFGALDTTDEQISGQGYTDCRLISVEVDTRFNQQANADNAVLVKTYETLTSSFVEITDPLVEFSDNGLKKITKVYRAVSGTTSTNTVGTTSLSSGEILASSKIEDNTALAELTEIYLEEGTLSESIEEVGSQKAIVRETIGSDPSTPSGYVIASKDESNFEGYQTNRFRFLKNNVTLSESEDKIGSQLAIVKEVFNGIPATPSGYSIANKQESNIDGIPTKRFSFLKNDVVLSESENKVGSQLAIVKEVFNGTPSTPSGYVIAMEEESDVVGIPTKRFTFLKENVVLSKSVDVQRGSKNASGVILQAREVQEIFKPDAIPSPETTGALLVGQDESDVDGIPTKRFTFVKGSGEIIKDERPAMPQLGDCQEVTITTLGADAPTDPTGVIISRRETENNGYKTFQVTAIQGTITGVKQTYKDVVEVTKAGIVSLDSISDSAGSISGSIGVAQVTPPRTVTLAATVTVEIVTDPPSTASLAYDLSQISCSVVSTTMSENFRGSDVFVTASGNSRFSGERKSASMSAKTQTYPNCYLSGTSNSGTFSYDSSYENTSTSPNTINAVAQTSTTTSKVRGTGATSDTSSQAGVLKRNSRPIFSGLENSTTYYEVITWSVGS